jgi:hypothetical protein
MLDENQIYQNKLSFVNLLSCLEIDLTELYTYLDTTDYFNKPASTQYFKAYPGGLCQYALDLYYELAQLVNAYCPGKYTKADVVKVALFKDIYRTELYECYMKNVKNDSTGNWEVQPAFRYKEQRPTFGDIGFSSYMIAKRFVDFTDEQIEAITQSAARSDYAGDIHDIMRSYPLVTLTKMADIAATYLSN